MHVVPIPVPFRPPETPCAKTRTETPEPGFLESRFVIHPSLFGATVAWGRAHGKAIAMRRKKCKPLRKKNC